MGLCKARCRIAASFNGHVFVGNSAANFAECVRISPANVAPPGQTAALAPCKARRGEHACNCALNEAGIVRTMGFAFGGVLDG